MPERSGHCIQGVSFKVHCVPNEREKEKQAMICEPGNLLDMREVLPSKAKHSAPAGCRLSVSG